MTYKFIPLIAAVVCAVPAQAQFTLDTTGTYFQNFNSITTLPLGWDLRTGATTSSLGTAGATYVGTPGANTAWNSTTGNFRNAASATGQIGNEDTATQSANPNRALAIRQSGAFGDPGGAFTFVSSTVNVLAITSISLDAQLLNLQPRSTQWTVRYSLGNAPTTFTTLGTFDDPGVFGSTNIAYNGLNITPDNSNILTVQVVALTTSSGTGSRDTFGIDNFAINYTPVPEPASLIAVAAAGLGAVTWRRRRKA